MVELVECCSRVCNFPFLEAFLHYFTFKNVKKNVLPILAVSKLFFFHSKIVFLMIYWQLKYWTPKNIGFPSINNILYIYLCLFFFHTYICIFFHYSTNVFLLNYYLLNKSSVLLNCYLKMEINSIHIYVYF